MLNPIMPRGLYMPDGSFQSFSAESLSTELATRERAGDLFALAGGSLGILPDPDPILRARGDDAEILTDLAADDQVATAMLSRKYRVLNQRNYSFTPGTAGKTEADGPAQLLCDHLTQDMERWVFTDLLSGILDAPFYGFSPLELIWSSEAGWWRLVDVIPRPPEWFGFSPEDNTPVWRGVNSMQVAALPPGKLVLARHFPTYKNPYGLRLLSRCLWPVAFKKGGIQFYVQFVEKYGMPWAIGTAPAKATREEKCQMAADLARMVQDAVAVIPAGSSVQLETASGQVGDLHERFLRRWDAAISKVLMGQTLTAELDGKGSYAAAETHKGVADDIAEADRRLVESALNEIAWLYCQVNAPQALSPVFSYAEQEDMLARAELDEKLSKIGVCFKASYFEKAYKLDPADFAMGKPVADSTPDQAASFAIPDLSKFPAAVNQEQLDAALESALPEFLRTNKIFYDQLAKMLSQAESFADAQLLLAEALSSELMPDELEEVLIRVMAAAAGRGHVAAKAEEH